MERYRAGLEHMIRCARRLGEVVEHHVEDDQLDVYLGYPSCSASDTRMRKLGWRWDIKHDCWRLDP